MKTLSAKPESVKGSWYIVDAKGKTLGRMASRIAAMLRGKNQPDFTPHVNPRVSVIVVNAAHVKVTGRKAEDKMYYRHSQYPGGLTEMNFNQLMGKFPERAVSFAIKGMLPKNSLGRAIFSNLKVYAGAEHPHVAQQPETIEVLS